MIHGPYSVRLTTKVRTYVTLNDKFIASGAW